MKRYRAPAAAGVVWVHVDNPRRKDGRVWAVQWREPDGALRYECARVVRICGNPSTVAHLRGRQPRLYLQIDDAQVEQLGESLIIVRGGS